MIARQLKELAMGLIKEFKEFALKGNFFDMAIGVVIGGAFGTIVTSLIKDIIMPVVSLPGNVDFTKSLIVLKENAADPAKSITLNYGAFVTVLINFLILAFVLFLVVKMYNAARKKFEAEKPAAAPAGPTADQKLLMEIRDLLAKR
jgi:large conductance mechanosensitive channel